MEYYTEQVEKLRKTALEKHHAKLRELEEETLFWFRCKVQEIEHNCHAHSFKVNWYAAWEEERKLYLDAKYATLFDYHSASPRFAQSGEPPIDK